MKRSFLSPLSTRAASATLATLALVLSADTTRAQTNNPSSAERFAKPSDELVARENKYWKKIQLNVPDEFVLEASGILPLPGKRLLVTTRRGEVYFIDGAYDAEAKPKLTLFASGLHEPLGIVAAPAPRKGYYIAQRQEVTRLEDTDGDGRADVFETIAKIPISGSYHEYAFGPVLAPNGNLRVTLNVAFGGATQAPVPWRGWFMDITPDGQMTPIAAGLRSPCGLILTQSGDWFYSDNQGEWVGSGKITHLERGDFTGHPAGLAWSKFPGSPVSLRPDDIKSFDEPMFDVAKRLPGVKPPAVWLPHTIQGISNAGMQEDLSGGKFGPFAGQLFVADQGQSKIVRVSLEKVRGVWQGASYAFRSGFDCGIIRLAQGEDGSFFTGETERGWGSLGPKKNGVERLVWTGEMPFEIKEIKAQPDGFVLTFTEPVDRAIAEKPESYGVSSFTYLWHKEYGSAPSNRAGCPVRKVVVAPDGLSVRLATICLREGYIHEIKAAGLKSAKTGEALLHNIGYYTLNRFPEGARIIPLEVKEAELCITPIPAVASANTKKHPTRPGADWAGEDGDKTIILGTQPGLKYDQPLLTAKAGSRVRLVFRNSDDMLHNFVLAAPGKGESIGAAALALGVDGAAKNYVPDSDDVLFHTALVLPEGSDTIYFNAPTTPGDYDFLCSFPGHSALMKGIFRVGPK